jgi:hypothetical protein
VQHRRASIPNAYPPLDFTAKICPRNLNFRITYYYNFACCFYGCEKWTLTLTELRVFENRVLRETFRASGDGIMGGQTKLHNEEFHNLHCSLNIIRIIKSRRMKWAGHA